LKSFSAALAGILLIVAASIAIVRVQTARAPHAPANIGRTVTYTPAVPSMRIGGGVSISQSWQSYPTRGTTHFAQLWRDHPECGRPIDRERRLGTTWFQRFRHCIMQDTVTVISTRPPPRPQPLATSVSPANTPTATTPPTPASPSASIAPTATVTTPPVPATPCSPDCSQWVLGQINAERAQYGELPLTLSPLLSNGDGSCIGAIGHAEHMANDLHAIAHDQFPADVCGSYSTAGENVGVSAYGSLAADVQQIHISMKSEPFSLGCSGNHHCDWMNPSFTRIGIGIVPGAYAGLPAHYLSEEFAG